MFRVFVRRYQVFIVRLKPRRYQQQCPNNIVECYKFNDSFDNIECCFDIFAVLANNDAGFGNSVERNFVLSTKSKQIESRNKLNIFNLFRLCRKDTISFDIVAETGKIVAKNGKNVEATFDIVERHSAIAYTALP